MRKAAVDKCRSRRRARQRRGRVREPKRRSAVPDILHRRIVVESGAIDQVRLSGTCAGVFADDPEVRIVDSAVTPQRSVSRRCQIVVRPLDETTHIVVDLACKENAAAAKHGAVVALINRRSLAGIGVSRLVVPRAGDRCLGHHRQWHIVRSLRREGRLADGVPGQLEVAAVRRELGKAHMARNALLTGLPRIGWNGTRRTDPSKVQQKHESRWQQCSRHPSFHCA